MLQAQALWNSRYRSDKQSWLRQSPRPLLKRFAHHIPKRGRVLDVACGVGTNGLYLTKRGFRVFHFDVSDVAVRLAKIRFSNAMMRFRGAVLDLETYRLPNEFFDGIINFCYLERNILKQYSRALKPGGLLVVETFWLPDRTDPKKHYLKPAELEETFNDFDLLHSELQLRKRGDGSGFRYVKQYVARKPV